MQPLNSLTFVRIGDANSHKYVINKKIKRHLKTLISNINNDWKQSGINTNLLDWFIDNYEADQEDLIFDWIKANRDIYNKCKDLYRLSKFSSNSYHSPPQKRGLYAFPQYRLETFLTHWDSSKFHIKQCNVGKKNESERRRAKKYITIKYNKPTLWCHFIDEAKELGVDIRVSKYWVLVNSYDYLKVLKLWEKKLLREHRNTCWKPGGNIKHCYKYGSKDDLEVFLVGV